MIPPARADDRSPPIRRLYDRAAGRLTVVLDVLPASADDVRVRVSPRRAVVTVERGRESPPPAGRGLEAARGRRSTRDGPRSATEVVGPPPAFAFDGDAASAVYHNGVLEVTLDLVADPARRGGA